MVNPKRFRWMGFFSSLLVIMLLAAWHPAYSQNTLQIRDVQVLNTNGNRICQHVYDPASQTYILAWQSATLEGNSSIRIGDIDNDGAKEIVASVLWQNRTETIKVGKRTTTQTWGSFRIEVFENGTAFNDGPSWSYDIPGEVLSSLPNDSYIADIDNDSLPGYPDNELVLIRSTELDLFHYTGALIPFLKEHLGTYSSFLFSLDVGDADNDGGNELVIVPGSSSALRVWKHLPDDGWEQKTVDPVPSTLWGPGMSYCGVTYARVRNADNIDGNEIIATGNNQRLMVWKWDGSGYRLTSTSEEFVATMAYGIDSGDLDGDGYNEVILSLWGAKRYGPRLVAMRYESGNWILKKSFDTNYIDQRDLRMGNLDGIGGPEIALNNGGTPAGLKLLAFTGTTLGGGTLREVYAAPGYGYDKVEIR